MIHIEHENLAGYDVRQIWHDGCNGCFELAQRVPLSVAHLDDFTLCRALRRAELYIAQDVDKTGKVAANEVALLTHLHSTVGIMRRLRHIGFSVTDIKP